MRKYAVLIDDGELIASSPGVEFPDMERAVASTVRAALAIVSDQEMTPGCRSLRCEVQDRGTRELRRLSVTVAVSIDQ
ncbi:DUF6894 family protein [Sphingomonas lenta]|uniref:DUF6894 domain-containing protein n=1 Tax=Sphingomonas lenta TaxID=1141887 RepID=A0A2A2SHW5_9SPHN|nr:hypothetical protein CKY28_05625 [Sphingomonas lenta]